MQLRLGTKFILIVVGILSLTLAVNTVLFLRSQHRLLEGQLLEQGRALGHFVSLVSPGSILSYDFLKLNEYAREVVQQRDVVYGVIVDPEGRPLTNYLDRNKPDLAALVGDEEPVKMERMLPRLEAIEELISLEFPIIHDGQTLGAFKLGLSRADLIRQGERQLWTQSGVYGAIILFLAAAIYLVFRLSVLFPVQRLIQASHHVARGEYRPVAVRSDDELGRLAEAFNFMVRGLEQERVKLHNQANYDSLTGLPNRMLAIERLTHEISRARRDRQQLAVLFIDLDDFKLVNDTLGHATGDRLLCKVGARLQSRLREVDTIARLGGDEFLVLLPQVGSAAEIEQVCARLSEGLAEPLRLKRRDVIVHCSIGVALFPEDGDSVETLMANADNAMYQAKSLPQSSVSFFTQEMNTRVQERLQMEQDLHRALERNELELHFQPLVDAATGRPRGAEVLLRWKHVTRGYISPAEFIPLAETTGQIIPIGDWVLRNAAHHWARWCGKGLNPGYMAVNISRVQFQERLAWVVGEVLAHYRLSPKSIELEITEGVLLDDHRSVMQELNALRAMGVGLALDDFGTGFSSLSYLKRFRFDVLKIDRSFVSGLPLDGEDASLVKAVIAMAHGMGLRVVAEGVETQAQFDYLRAEGCDYGQGYFFARPMDADAFEQYLTRIDQEQTQPLSMTVYPRGPR